MFESIMALATGLIFGFLMQRSEVLRYDRQLGALLLEDMTIVKFMMSAVCTGMVGIQLLSQMGFISLSIKSTVLGTNLVGGVIFGLGWAMLGYCPGTAVGALGEGRIDALAGIAGMVVGAILFAELYPFTKLSIFSWGDLGKITLPSYTDTSPWLWVAGFLALAGGLSIIFDRNDL
nr:DUF6691 family protein [uncultured Dethiosulfovibrio sp.]